MACAAGSIRSALKCIPDLQFRFAKTMADNPHWYVRTPENEADFG
jgi:hypothetical protein